MRRAAYSTDAAARWISDSGDRAARRAAWRRSPRDRADAWLYWAYRAITVASPEPVVASARRGRARLRVELPWKSVKPRVECASARSGASPIARSALATAAS